MARKTRIGIVGCGALGSEIAGAVHGKFADLAELAAVSDLDRSKAVDLVKQLGLNIPVCLADEVIELSDLVVEAANASVSKDIASAALIQDKNVLVMSVAGLINAPEVMQLAHQSAGRLYIPSGEIGGIDALKAAAEDRVDLVRLTTRVPEDALRGAPYIEASGPDLDSISEETVVFEGTVLDAVKGFPENLNASAALCFAGVGPEKTLVRIIVSPGLSTNIHEIEIEGSFGRLRTTMENVPAADAPRTSYLAVLSAVAMIRRILYALKVGT